MILKVYSIYDSKAEAYVRPFFAPTKGLALRSVLAALQDPNHDLSKYPADYTLFELGEWDDQTGLFTPHNTKQNLGVMLEHISNNKDSRSGSITDQLIKKEETEAGLRIEQ